MVAHHILPGLAQGGVEVLQTGAQRLPDGLSVIPGQAEKLVHFVIHFLQDAVVDRLQMGGYLLGEGPGAVRGVVASIEDLVGVVGIAVIAVELGHLPAQGEQFQEDGADGLVFCLLHGSGDAVILLVFQIGLVQSGPAPVPVGGGPDLPGHGLLVLADEGLLLQVKFALPQGLRGGCDGAVAIGGGAGIDGQQVLIGGVGEQAQGVPAQVVGLVEALGIVQIGLSQLLVGGIGIAGNAPEVVLGLQVGILRQKLVYEALHRHFGMGGVSPQSPGGAQLLPPADQSPESAVIKGLQRHIGIVHLLMDLVREGGDGPCGEGQQGQGQNTGHEPAAQGGGHGVTTLFVYGAGQGIQRFRPAMVLFALLSLQRGMLWPYYTGKERGWQEGGGTSTCANQGRATRPAPD